MFNSMEKRKVVDRNEINDEAKSIAEDYLRYRLLKSGFDWTMPTIDDQSRRFPVEQQHPTRVMLVLRDLCDEFERKYSNVYGEMCSSLNIHVIGTSYPNFEAICDQLFRDEDYYNVKDDRQTIKWSRIVAMYAFSGYLAVELVRNNTEWYVQHLVSSIYQYVRSKLSYWICKQGGWDALITYAEARSSSPSAQIIPLNTPSITTIGAACGIVAMAVMVARHLGSIGG